MGKHRRFISQPNLPDIPSAMFDPLAEGFNANVSNMEWRNTLSTRYAKNLARHRSDR